MASTSALLTIVAGAQFGDEAKGRFVDLLCNKGERVHYGIRCQGGPNAGHTVDNEYGTFKLHGLPSCIFSNQTIPVIGQGTVIDPIGLAAEIKEVEQKGKEKGWSGVGLTTLIISELAHVIMPYHVTLDKLEEQRRGNNKLGTTCKGVGPAYASKASRRGIQARYLRDEKQLEQVVVAELQWVNEVLTKLYGALPLTVSQVLTNEFKAAAKELAAHIQPTVGLVSEAFKPGQHVLLEGQLGILKDIDAGIYPQTTASSPSPCGMLLGSGLPMLPSNVQVRCVGVMKAYTTSVGGGRMPTKDEGKFGQTLQREGNEIGASTGRQRDCGALDLVALKYAIRTAGFTELFMAKLDVLSHFKEIPVCTGYKIGNQILKPEDLESPCDLADAVAQYETYPGWREDISGCRKIEDLPKAARQYIDMVQRWTGLPVSLISVGPEREAFISQRPMGGVD